ncbi:MAG: hypothetical protein KJO07_01885 [Deltaproteobacteria bacterium]|nr:hypothetical protein [Deltaproteobacteria bacterium]
MIKHRPKIRLYTDKQVVIGRPTTLRLVLDARAEVTLESLSLFLERRVTSMQRV